MPTSLFKGDLNLDHVYPPFLERLLELKARCRAKGSSYLCTYLFRSIRESDALYEIYRHGGARAAPGGFSSHNFGLASDEALIISPSPKRVLRWDKADFQLLGEESIKLGLHWGAGYGDSPHVSWPGFVDGAQLKPLRELWYSMDVPNAGYSLMDRLKACWRYVDAHSDAVPPFTPSPV